MTRRLLPLLVLLPLLLPATADAAWQRGVTYDGATTQICSVPKGQQIAIRYRIDARRAGDGYGQEGVVQGGVFRVRNRTSVYDYDKQVQTVRGRISGTRSMFFARTAQVDAWIGNRVSLAGRKRFSVANVTRC